MTAFIRGGASLSIEIVVCECQGIQYNFMRPHIALQGQTPAESEETGIEAKKSGSAFCGRPWRAREAVLKLSKGLLVPALALPAIVAALPPSVLRDDLLLLWFSLTPLSIFVYSSRTWRLQRWKLGILGGLELLLFFGIWWLVFLVVGENCYPGLPCVMFGSSY